MLHLTWKSIANLPFLSGFWIFQPNIGFPPLLISTSKFTTNHSFVPFYMANGWWIFRLMIEWNRSGISNPNKYFKSIFSYWAHFDETYRQKEGETEWAREGLCFLFFIFLRMVEAECAFNENRALPLYSSAGLTGQCRALL